jgi:antitoxin ParD1/3/4
MLGSLVGFFYGVRFAHRLFSLGAVCPQTSGEKDCSHAGFSCTSVLFWCNNESLKHQYGGFIMTRQSISFTEPNDDWLKAQVESREYTSKSDVVNDLIRKARTEEQERELAIIRAKLIQAEKSGFTDKTAHEIRAEAKEELKLNGDL